IPRLTVELLPGPIVPTRDNPLNRSCGKPFLGKKSRDWLSPWKRATGKDEQPPSAMLFPAKPPTPSPLPESPTTWWLLPLKSFARRRPFVALFLMIVLSNVAGSYFNFMYNDHLIVRHTLDEDQRRVFWNVVAPVYNFVAYPLCLGL